MACFSCAFPPITIPVGVTFSQPAPELRAWSKQERTRTPQGGATPPPNPHSPTKQDLALRWFAPCQASHPALHVHCLVADALSGTAPCVEGASAIVGGAQVLSQLRSYQQVRLHKRAQHVADAFAPHRGTPQTIRIRGGEEGLVIVGRARLYVCASPPRVIVALKYADEDRYRSLLAADLPWRPLDMVQAQTLRGLVEVCIQDWKSYEGWHQLTQQPGEEGARRRVLLSLLVEHALCFHPDQHAQCSNHLPAYTVGSLRAHVPVECLVDVIQELVSSKEPQRQLQRVTQAFHAMFAFGRSTKHMLQRQWGRLEPTPHLQYRADEVMRNMPARST